MSTTTAATTAMGTKSAAGCHRSSVPPPITAQPHVCREWQPTKCWPPLRRDQTTPDRTSRTATLSSCRRPLALTSWLSHEQDAEAQQAGRTRRGAHDRGEGTGGSQKPLGEARGAGAGQGAVLETYAQMAPEALDSLTPEERHQFYRMLRLRVVVQPGGRTQVSGAFNSDRGICTLETTSGGDHAPGRC
jgi:hypothetical protein